MVTNLNIAKVEIRSETDADVVPHVHDKLYDVVYTNNSTDLTNRSSSTYNTDNMSTIKNASQIIRNQISQLITTPLQALQQADLLPHYVTVEIANTFTVDEATRYVLLVVLIGAAVVHVAVRTVLERLYWVW